MTNQDAGNTDNHGPHSAGGPSIALPKGLPAPDFDEVPGVALYKTNCLETLAKLPDACAAAVITDPPYSSGGTMRSDRTSDPNTKYVQTGVEIVRHSFSGDNRDGRSWCYWCALWMSEAARVVQDNGYGLFFTDWRMLPLCSDALQAGGFVWRGLISWDKGRGARGPHTGYFRHQCEYVAWGTIGVSKPSSWGGPWPGSFTITVKQSDKHHITGKPTALMEELVQCAPPGGVVLDPFMGSGTTGVACVKQGRAFIGVEQSPEYFDIAVERIRKAHGDGTLFADDSSEQMTIGGKQ